MQHYTFYDFIVNKARGKSGPLFNFDVHDDVRLISDATREKDESHAGKVVERSWYNRFKHVSKRRSSQADSRYSLPPDGKCTTPTRTTAPTWVARGSLIANTVLMTENCMSCFVYCPYLLGTPCCTFICMNVKSRADEPARATYSGGTRSGGHPQVSGLAVGA